MLHAKPMKRFSRWIFPLTLGMLSMGVEADEDLGTFAVIPLGEMRSISDVTTHGRTAYVTGSVSSAAGTDADAVLVAIDGIQGSRLWERRVGRFGSHEGFVASDLDAGRVCVVGFGFANPGFRENRLLVACYRESDGAILWERDLPYAPFQFANDPTIHLAGQIVFVEVSVRSTEPEDYGVMLLSFDARDGS